MADITAQDLHDRGDAWFDAHPDSPVDRDAWHRQLDLERNGQVNPTGPRTSNGKSAIGPMQIMPDTAKDFGIIDPYDPMQNIDGGLTILDHHVRELNGNNRLGFAAYHAGLSAVQKAGGIPNTRDVNMSTREYVNRIMPPGKVINDIGDEVKQPKQAKVPESVWDKYPTGYGVTPEAEPESEGVIGGAAKDFSMGLSGLGSAVGKGVKMAGNAVGSQSVSDLGDSTMEYWNARKEKTFASMSPEHQKALTDPIFNDDWSLGNTPLTTLYHNTVQMAPALLATGVAGKGLGLAFKGLDYVAASSRGAKILEALGMPAEQAASASTRLVSGLATGTQYGVPQGLVFGLQAGAEAQAQANKLTPEQLAASPAFQKIYAETDPSLPDQRRKELAQNELADRFGTQNAIDTAMVFGGFGMLSGGGALAPIVGRGYTGGMVARAAKGAGAEAATLSAQMGGQQILANKATQEYINPNQPTMAGVPNAIGSAIGFAPFGAAGGAMHPRAGEARPGERASNQEARAARVTPDEEDPFATPQPPLQETAAPLQEAGATPNEVQTRPELVAGDIGKKSGGPFLNPQAARMALAKLEGGKYAETHEVVPTDGGFVLRPKDADKAAAPSPEATQGEPAAAPAETSAKTVSAEPELIKTAEVAPREAAPVQEISEEPPKVDTATGEVPQAHAEGTAPTDVTRNDGTPFATRAEANQTLRAKPLGAKYDAVKIGDDQWVLRKRAGIPTEGISKPETGRPEDKMVTVRAVEAESGRTVRMKMRAGDALKHFDQHIERAKNLLECLNT